MYGIVREECKLKKFLRLFERKRTLAKFVQVEFVHRGRTVSWIVIDTLS
jgi:hypothetical protein